MKEARFFYAPNAEDNDRLLPEEAAHALRVLRLKAVCRKVNSSKPISVAFSTIHSMRSICLVGAIAK